MGGSGPRSYGDSGIGRCRPRDVREAVRLCTVNGVVHRAGETSAYRCNTSRCEPDVELSGTQVERFESVYGIVQTGSTAGVERLV